MCQAAAAVFDLGMRIRPLLLCMRQAAAAGSLRMRQAAATAAQLALARGGEKTFMRLLLSTGRD